MKTQLLFIICGLLIPSLDLMAQHNGEQPAGALHEEESDPFKVALTFGYTHIPAGVGSEEGEAVFVPTIGLDLFYSLNHKWSLGLVADLEMSEYIVDFGREELNREKAFILALLAGYEVLPRWKLLTGAGIELEKNKNLMVVRFGTEYDFPLGKGWSMAPSTFFDFKEEYSTWALSVSIGKTF